MTTPLLDQVRAQPTATATLARALASGRVHHAYLFDGPEGVGKELAALGLAQALVCERRAPGEAKACGECSACRRAIIREGEARPTHPDVVILARGLYEPAQIGRRTPETQDISIDQVRTLVLARAAFPPHEGRAKVFVVRAAEELSTSAANALLKTLEEPGASTHFVLLSSQPDALLPTIRSRTQRVRFGPLPDDVVRDLLAARGAPEAARAEIVRLAAGSMANALALADEEESAKRDAFVGRAMRALETSDLSAVLDVAEEAKKASRDALALQIRGLAAALAEKGRAAAGDPSEAAAIAAARHALALQALRELDGNASPQLVVEALLTRMRAA